MERGRADDRRHPLLSKADDTAQRKLDRDDAPKRALGSKRIREVTVRQALTDFTFGGTRSGAAWSLNPYAGCHHACLYCYVPDTMRAERRRWGDYVLVKRNAARLLADELDRKAMRTVYVATGTDPYQPVEADRRLTRRLLDMLADADWPVEVLTRSPLVLDDVDVLHRFSHLRVGLSVPTLDDDARRLLEPGTPPVSARLDALETLADAGFTTFANLSPAYPLTGGWTAEDVAERLRDAGVRWVNTSYWRRRDRTVPWIWDRLEGTEHEDVAKFIAQRPRQEALREDLADAFDAVGVPMHTGFYNPPFEIASLRPRHEQVRLDQVPVRVHARARLPSR